MAYFQQYGRSQKSLIPKGKGGEDDNRKDLRPIALNSILGKALEKLLNNRLYFFLVQHKLLASNQYGFKHKTSTIDALENKNEYKRGSRNRK